MILALPETASNTDADQRLMSLALEQARMAFEAGEVPVGAIVVKDGQVIGAGYNAPIARHDPSAHAEIVALRNASLFLKNYRLEGCELFVTLEPCAMCAGAIVNARLARLVFGAYEPKSGAAGSVLNLFENQKINPHTRVQGGVLANECSQLLHLFFQGRRRAQRVSKQPLREDALRTPDQRFEHLIDYPWIPRYVSDLPALNGLRMHYLDEGSPEAPVTWLCLHESPRWSYSYRKMLPVFLAAGHRIVAPDMIGFGKSDKPKKEGVHSLAWHKQILVELVQRLDLQRVVLILPIDSVQLGMTLPVEDSGRYLGLIVISRACLDEEDAPVKRLIAKFDTGVKTIDADDSQKSSELKISSLSTKLDAYAAPFPDAGHRAAVRFFSMLLTKPQNDDEAEVPAQFQDFWRDKWTGLSMVALGVTGDLESQANTAHSFYKTIRNCPPPVLFNDFGDFEKEPGEAVACAALAFIKPPNCHA